MFQSAQQMDSVNSRNVPTVMMIPAHGLYQSHQPAQSFALNIPYTTTNTTLMVPSTTVLPLETLADTQKTLKSATKTAHTSQPTKSRTKPISATTTAQSPPTNVIQLAHSLTAHKNATIKPAQQPQLPTGNQQPVSPPLILAMHHTTANLVQPSMYHHHIKLLVLLTEKLTLPTK